MRELLSSEQRRGFYKQSLLKKTELYVCGAPQRRPSARRPTRGTGTHRGLGSSAARVMALVFHVDTLCVCLCVCVGGGGWRLSELLGVESAPC